MSTKKNSSLAWLCGSLLTGAAALIPLAGTLWLLFILYKALLRCGEGIVDFIWKLLFRLSPQLASQFDFLGVEIVHLLVPLLLLFGVGVLLANPTGRKACKVIETTLQGLPVVGFIYKSLSQFVASVQNLRGEKKFQSVVFVEYPGPGCRLIGFVTGEFEEGTSGGGVTSVFVPTSPNPLTGFLILIDNDKIQPSDMTVEQASKMVLSAGLVTPNQ